ERQHVGVGGGAQVGQGGAREQERAAGVDVEHEVVAAGVEIGDRRQVDRAGVVDHEVDTAEALDRGVDESGDVVLVSDVADNCQRGAAGALDLGGGGVDGARQPRVGLVGLCEQGDVGAGPGDRDGDGETDAAAASGDEDGAVG